MKNGIKKIEYNVAKIAQIKDTEKWRYQTTERSYTEFDTETDLLNDFGNDGWWFQTKEKVSETKFETIFKYTFAQPKQE